MASPPDVVDSVSNPPVTYHARLSQKNIHQVIVAQVWMVGESLAAIVVEYLLVPLRVSVLEIPPNRVEDAKLIMALRSFPHQALEISNTILTKICTTLPA